jgi:hypothetical protein
MTRERQAQRRRDNDERDGGRERGDEKGARREKGDERRDEPRHSGPTRPGGSSRGRPGSDSNAEKKG